MCGITGIISKKVFTSKTLQGMNNSMLHRGPNGEGYMFSIGIELENEIPGTIEFRPATRNFIGLGHRRLAIVDLSSLGHQPMTYGDRYVITYNGEIYNHNELRRELSKIGYKFKSESDTEVVIAAYDAWGSDCINKFNGMWAFLILDTSKRLIFASRDRLGVKPLYYYKNRDLLIFASEIKAILKHPDVQKQPNWDYLKKYLKQGPTVHLPMTAFNGISAFPAASYLECDYDTILETPLSPKEYWSIQPNTEAEPYDEGRAQRYADEYFRILQDAVKLRLRADVKVGSALSGGIDSSSIVYLINRALSESKSNNQQETFSCVYKTDGASYCDESAKINIIAKHLSVISKQIEPKEDCIPDEHKKMIYMMDHPPESTCMSGWHTFKLVSSSGVTVTLDGQGADEQLAGYPKYWGYHIAQLSIGDAFRAFRRAFGMNQTGKYALIGLVICMMRSIFGKKITLRFINAFYVDANPFQPINTILKNDCETSLQTLIHYSDRVSMAFSVESRMPFLDYRLVEFLASVPSVYKLHDGWSKYIARKAFSGKLPDKIVWDKEKKGWPIPEEYWFSGGLKSWIDSTTGFCDTLTNQLAIPQKFSVNGSKISVKVKVRFLNLAVWYKTFFKDSIEERSVSDSR
jgi:asparagine synthase (glutamine-hydrolysing)